MHLQGESSHVTLYLLPVHTHVSLPEAATVEKGKVFQRTDLICRIHRLAAPETRGLHVVCLEHVGSCTKVDALFDDGPRPVVGICNWNSGKEVESLVHTLGPHTQHL